MDETNRGRPDRPDRMGSEVGTLLCGRYRLDHVLGRGGMGEVYRARDLELGESIAIKLLHKLTLDVVAVERLRQEVRLARRVTHRNVARIHDIAIDHETYFLTMQLVEGETLREAFRCGPLPRERAIEIVTEICEGLSAAHDVGVVHLDLKPDNVMLARGGGIVILDFGIASFVMESHDHASGTPGYMAPEQRFGGPYDARTDLYALGIMLHELLTGSRPSEGGDQLDAVPAPLRALITSLTAVDPDERPGSARLVADALSALDVVPTGTRTERLPVGRRIAVLPFATTHDDEELAAGFTEELVNRLTTLRDTCVLSARATRALGGDDFAMARNQLDVEHIVEGSLRRAGNTVQVTIRLVERSGIVAWTDRFEGPLVDVLHFQDRMAHRIAEALRVELGVRSYRGGQSDEMVTLYLRARRKVASMILDGDDGAVADLDRIRAANSDFVPALALRALAYARGWFLGIGDDVDGFRARATAAVAEAVTSAADLPETYLARAVMALQNGDLPGAARHLVRSLELAPTNALAHEYLGRLQCEAGRVEGIQRIAFAQELDPSLWIGVLDIARHYALHRLWDRYQVLMAELAQRRGADRWLGSRTMQMRVAAWTKNDAAVRRWAAEIAALGQSTMLFATYGAVVVGDQAPHELAELVASICSHRVSRRFAGYAHQLVAEAAGVHGDHVRALHHVVTASKLGLVDVEWLDLCPALDGSRGLDGFATIRRDVRKRAAVVWLDDGR